MFVFKHRKIFYWISGILVGLSLLSLIVWGLNFGIDFTGGSLLEVSYSAARPDMATLQTNLDQLQLGDHSIRPVGENGYILRTKTLTEENRLKVLQAMSPNGS